MRALVIGGDGQVGHALVEKLRADGHQVLPTSRHLNQSRSEGAVRFDMLDPRLPLAEHDPEHIVFIVAAVTGIMRCESDQDAWRINADGPAALALQAHARGWHVVFVSSDAVETAPRLNYAQAKAYAENVVLALGGCVVRPARILPERLPDLVDLLMRSGIGKIRGLVRWEG